MAWLAVSIDLDELSAEAAEEAFFAAGALAVTLTDPRDDHPVLEPAPGEVRLWPATRLTATFDADAAGAGLIADIATRLDVPAKRLLVEAIGDRAWEREWLRDFHAMRFGERLWVCPTHERVTDADAIVVTLDPGLAFGTGTHATTALCLEWLDAHPPRDLTVIDYGCGSGILALAAAKLGARSAHAFDIDPQALIATRDNAAANDSADRVIVHESPASLPAGCDVLIANILAGPLAELAGDFAGLVRPGGALLLSGLLEPQADEVARACAPWFDISICARRDDWVALAGVRHRG